MLDVRVKTMEFAGSVAFLASKDFRAIPVTIDETYVNADGVTGIKKVAAGTILGKVSGQNLYRPYVAATAATAASLTTAGGNANSHLTFTAVTAGLAGEAIKIAMLDNAGNNNPLEVTIVNNEIRIQLATDGAGAVTSTAAEVMAAVNASILAKQLVVASLVAEETGAGVVAALAATALDGGAEGTAASTTPACVLLEEVVLTDWHPQNGASHADKASFAVESGRIIEARLPVSPDAVVKAALKAITWA